MENDRGQYHLAVAGGPMDQLSSDAPAKSEKANHELTRNITNSVWCCLVLIGGSAFRLPNA